MKKENNQSHNQITPTADLICYYRIFSDTPYTKDIAKITNAEKTAKDILGDTFNSSYPMAVMAESRYKRIDEKIKGYKNILEVAVGRSPRGLIFTADKDVNYVATDLPDSLENYKAIMSELLKKYSLTRPNLKYVPVHVLNSEELKSASDLLPNGPIAFISEGLMIYLPKEEKRIFLENIRNILKKRGGIMVTPDLMVFGAKTAQNNPVLAKVAQSSGRDMRDFGFSDQAEAVKFLNDIGFSVDVSTPNVPIKSITELQLENNPLIKRYLDMPVWVLSVKK